MIQKAAIWALIFTLILTMLSSCGGADDIDVSQYGEEKVTFVGLGSQDEVLTINQLKELGCVTEKTHSTSDKIGDVSATGPLLSTVLESYGHKQDEFSKVIIYGEDDYDIKLDKDFLKENEIILAIGMDGEPLKEEDTPIRIIIPESDSAYWVRMVSKIELVK